jgi:hypothetical protein
MRDESVEVVCIAGQPVDTDERRLSLATEVQVMQLESAGSLKSVQLV